MVKIQIELKILNFEIEEFPKVLKSTSIEKVKVVDSID